MKLNYNSWFCNKFLMLHSNSYDFPQTICQLGRRIVMMTIMWFAIAICSLVVIAHYLGGLFGILYVLFTSATFNQVFPFHDNINGFMESGFIMFVCVNIIAAVIFGAIGINSYMEGRKTRKYFNAKMGNYTKPNTPVRDFVKGIWQRIHEKTCVIIEWENDPAEKRRKREEEFNKLLNQ